MQRNHFTIIFTTVLFVTLVVFYFPWLSGAKAFYLTDITNHFEPTTKILSECWRKREFQLWNPYSQCGEPQIAIPQPGLFYPLNFLFAVMPFSQAFAWNLILHQLLAGIGSFLLIASLGWGVFPAALCGLIASLNAYMFSASTNFTLMACGAWIPMAFWSLRSRYFALGVFSIAMMIACGRPEIYLPGLALLGAYIFSSLYWDLKHHFFDRQKVVLQAMTIVLGIAIAAPCILPCLEWQAISPRATGLVGAEVLIWSANWYDLVSMILMQPVGDLWVHPEKYLNLVAARQNFAPYLIAFVGPVVVTLAAFSLADLKKTGWRFTGLVLFALGLTLIVSAGSNTPIGPFMIEHFPKLGILRYPVKLLFFADWFFAILAARGLYLMLEGQVGKKVQAGISVCLLVLFGFSAWLMTLGEPQSLFGQAGLLAASVGAFVVVLLRLYNAGLAKRTTVLLGVFCLVLVTLLTHAFTYSYHAADANFYEQNPSYIQKQLSALHEDVSRLDKGQEARFVALYFPGLLMPAAQNNNGNCQWPASYYQYGRQMLCDSTHFDQGLCSSFGYEGAETWDYRKIFVEAFNKSHFSGGPTSPGFDSKSDLPFYRFCQITSTAYACSLRDKTSGGRITRADKPDATFFDLLVDDADWNLRIYKVKDPMPRCYIAFDIQPVNDLEHAIGLIIGADKSGFDPRKKTLIETSSNQLPSDSSVTKAGQAELTLNTANKMTVHVKSKTSGFLVLTDHFYPGWIAEIDGSPVEIVRANAIMRAVPITAGDHVVDFVYAPESLRAGIRISLLALIGLIVIVCVGPYKTARVKSE